jgi:hypothetical protein
VSSIPNAYRKINPRRVVPTLVLDDGTAIGEVPAIMRYLDEAFLVNPLPGTTPEDTVASMVIAAFSGAPPNRAQLLGGALVIGAVTFSALSPGDPDLDPKPPKPLLTDLSRPTRRPPRHLKIVRTNVRTACTSVDALRGAAYRRRVWSAGCAVRRPAPVRSLGNRMHVRVRLVCARERDGTRH